MTYNERANQDRYFYGEDRTNKVSKFLTLLKKENLEFSPRLRLSKDLRLLALTPDSAIEICKNLTSQEVKAVSLEDTNPLSRLEYLNVDKKEGVNRIKGITVEFLYSLDGINTYIKIIRTNDNKFKILSFHYLGIS
jgi:hypothetical protein